MNLGLEGVMLVGAVVGFIATVHTGSAGVGVVAAALAGALFNLLFAFLVLTRRANQLATGLALMFCGVGVSALLGARGRPDHRPARVSAPTPCGPARARPALFVHDVLVYAAVPLAVLTHWVLFSTRWGLSVRAVGENPIAAFAAGKDPRALQYQALFIAGLLGGVAGAHLSLGVARTWAEWMTAGRGFIAVALIFSRWLPLRAVVGAMLFGRDLAADPAAGAGRPGLALSPRHAAVPVEPGRVGRLGRAHRKAAPGSLGRVFQGRNSHRISGKRSRKRVGVGNG